MIGAEERITAALLVASQWSQIDGAHHKAHAIDQMVRALHGCPIDPKTEAYGENDAYRRFVAAYQAGEDGPETYEWDVGIAP